MIQSAMPDRPQKRSPSRRCATRGIIVYCADYTCSHSIVVNADQWPDDLPLSNIEHRFICAMCGKRGADVRRGSIDAAAAKVLWNPPIGSNISESP
jgi:hypothetical protein